MTRKFIYWFHLTPILAILLASCTAVQTQTPAPLANPAPASSPTATVTVATEPPASPTATAGLNDTSTLATAASAAGASANPAGAGIVCLLVPAKSQASFAVREQLAGRDLPNDAVGTTQAITGTVTINADGSIDIAHSKFTVDLSTLRTDEPMRDNYIKRNILHTGQYPQATFVPKQVSGISPDISQTGAVSFKMTGDLTIQNVTKSITWDVTGTITPGEASGKAVTSFSFEDFNLNQPRVPMVLSIVDKITLTITVDFVRQ